MRGRRARGRWQLVAAVASLAVALGAAQPALPEARGHPISHDAPQITEITPAAGSVVRAGSVTVSALVAADAVAGSVTFDISGTVVDAETVDDDGHQRAQAQAVLSAGSHVVRVTATTGEQRVERAWRFEAVAMTDRRLAGPTRAGTAAVIASALTGDDDAPAAVLGRSDDFADALAGVGLAHRVGGPLLLTGGDALDQAARDALTEHVGAGAVVHLLGGEAALSGQIAADVAALGFEPRRLAGADRYETARRVAEAAELDGDSAQTDPATADEAVAVIASGEQFADALAMSAPAARAGWPLLLTAAETLPESTRAYLQGSDVERIEIVGGPDAVSEAVATQLAALAPVSRTGGISRYDTAAQIARTHPGGVVSGVVLADGGEFADGLAGGVLAAQRAQPLVLAAERLPQPSAALLGELAVAEVTVLGGEAAVPAGVVEDVRRVVYDGALHDVAMEPAADSVVEQTSDDGGQGLGPIRLRLPGALLDNGSQATVWVGGRQAVSATRTEGDTLVVELTELPVGLPVEGDVAVRVVAALQGGGSSAHVERSLVQRRTPQLPPVVTTSEGYLAIGEAGAVVGGGGPLRTYSLEVEASAGIDVHAFAEQAEATLSDPRSWTGRGDVRLQRVEPGQARIRVLLATPATVDRLCARAGLDTGGIYSCWNGRFAALNLNRWNSGASGFYASLPVYRGYVVNHEVGHGLGHGHAGCPGRGRLAPVMMQQTKGTGACVPNPWPYP